VMDGLERHVRCDSIVRIHCFGRADKSMTELRLSGTANPSTMVSLGNSQVTISESHHNYRIT